MFSSFDHSWRLMGHCWQVLRKDRELIVFPICSSLSLILVSLVFLLPYARLAPELMGQQSADGQAAEWSFRFGDALFLFLYYFVSYAIIIFANSALIGAALIRLRGGDPTVRDGLRIAGRRVRAILGYAFIAATVGTLLHLLDSASRSRNAGIGARIIAAIISTLFSLAWSLMTYLVVPVLVVENVGPIESIQRSASLLRRTWGEQIAGNISFGLVTAFLLLIVALLLTIPTMLLMALVGRTVALWLAGALYIVVLGALLMTSNALAGIYQAALYLYATEGGDTPPFRKYDFAGAFRYKD